MEGRTGVSRASALVVIALFLAIALVTLSVNLTGPGEPTLSMDVTPPGYPVTGSHWSIQVWQPGSNGNLVPAKNATVLVETNGMRDYQLQTDPAGGASFTYQDSYGQVTIVANKTGFLSTSYVPVATFVSSDTAWQAVGVFWGASALSGGFLVKFRGKLSAKGTTVLGRASYVLGLATSLVVVGTLVVGLPLTFSWVYQWGNGSAYGFNNSIAWGISYNPDLLGLLFTLVGGTVFLGILGYFQAGRRFRSGPEDAVKGRRSLGQDCIG